MKITTETVRRVAAHAHRLTGGVHGLAFVHDPGDPPRYVDRHTPGRTFAGPGAARCAAAFYTGMVDALPGANPPLIDTVLAEVSARHTALIEAGRAAAVPPHAGYICKRCAGPSPVGVGYVSDTPGAAAASAGREACDCGHSQHPSTSPTPSPTQTGA